MGADFLTSNFLSLFIHPFIVLSEMIDLFWSTCTGCKDGVEGEIVCTRWAKRSFFIDSKQVLYTLSTPLCSPLHPLSTSAWTSFKNTLKDTCRLCPVPGHMVRPVKIEPFNGYHKGFLVYHYRRDPYVLGRKFGAVSSAPWSPMFILFFPSALE